VHADNLAFKEEGVQEIIRRKVKAVGSESSSSSQAAGNDVEDFLRRYEDEKDQLDSVHYSLISKEMPIIACNESVKLEKKQRKQWKKLRTTQLARILASNQRNLAKYFATLKILYISNKYPYGIIINMDEKSLLVKKSSSGTFRICSTQCNIIPQQPEQLITSCTALFCVAADGYSFATALIFPDTLDLSSIKDFIPKDIYVFQSKKGWMTKQIFRFMMKNIYIPALIKRREQFRGARRCLILIDGLSSRLCVDVQQECSEKQIDVLVPPSHTTHLIQALDRGVNAVFKMEIKKHSVMPKAKRDMQDMILPFVYSVIQCIQRTLTITTIQHGFLEAGVVPYDRNRIFSNIPQEPPYRAVISGEIRK
ncbi:MAG: hypothetical protein EZS28_037344, partial [Streblomastix strix]